MRSSLSIAALDTRYRGLRLVDPTAREAIHARLQAGAEIEPIVVWQDVDGCAVVIDGFKRVEAACLLELTEVPVEFLQGAETQAVAAIAALNGARRGLSQMEEAWIVARLCEEHQLSQAEVSALMGRHVSWVCRRKTLAERLCPGLQDDVRLGLLSATSAREIARLPRGNQQRMAQCVYREGLSTRQVAHTCRLLLGCTDEAVDEVLANPMRFMADDVTQVDEHDPRLSAPAEAARQAIERVDEDVRRLRACLRRLPAPRATDLAILLPRLRELCTELAQTSEQLARFLATHEEERDDRPTHLAEI